MATRLENLIQARDNLEAALIAATLDPMPDYDLDGQEFRWGNFIDQLTKQIESLNKLIDKLTPPKVHWLGKRHEEQNR